MMITSLLSSSLPLILLVGISSIITSTLATPPSVYTRPPGALPRLPQTCGFVYDDPHIVTFDRLVYECQAEGDYILSKSLAAESEHAFELQGRYHRGDAWGWTRTGEPGTTTIGAVLKTGWDEEPTVEIDASNMNDGSEDGSCNLQYFMDGQSYDLESIAESDFQSTIGNSNVQFYNRGSSRYFFFDKSGLSLRISVRNHRIFGCFLNVKLCIPDDIRDNESIVGQLGSPDDDKMNDFMNRNGTTYEALEPVLHSYPEGYWGHVHDYCTQIWCVHDDNSLFRTPSTNGNCEATPYKGTVEHALENDDPTLKEICGDDIPCLVDGDNSDPETANKTLEDGRELQGEEKIPDETPTPQQQQANVFGDPHFKTWTGDKFDYHGACDLVLVDNPTFHNGLGLKIHIRTTRVQYYSYIERVAVQIGSDVLEFDNDVTSVLLNGQILPPPQKHHNTTMGDGKFLVRRDPNAISIRLDAKAKTKIDLIERNTGFPGVVVDGGSNPQLFKGSLGLLGQWGTGKWIARDGTTDLKEHGAGVSIFALEWQVRASQEEPMLFQESRHPQFPARCLPPKTNTLLMGNGKGRIGVARAKKLAEKACSHWNLEDQAECIFDVLATRNTKVALEVGTATTTPASDASHSDSHPPKAKTGQLRKRQQQQPAVVE